MQASHEELLEAEEVGAKIADSIIEYFADEQNRSIIERLVRAGLKFEAEAKVLSSQALEGMNIVISGSFTQLSRDELKAMIEAHGGKNQAAVAANTTYLLAGEKIGPAKLQKANKLGIRIISEQEFLTMIEGAEPLNTEPLATAEAVAEPAPAPEPPKAEPTTPIQGTLF